MGLLAVLRVDRKASASNLVVSRVDWSSISLFLAASVFGLNTWTVDCGVGMGDWESDLVSTLGLDTWEFDGCVGGVTGLSRLPVSILDSERGAE